MGMGVGQARVCTVGQKLGVLLGHLADCDRIYREKISVHRPELINALDLAKKEDVFGAKPKLTTQNS